MTILQEIVLILEKREYCIIFLLINCYTGTSTPNAIAEVWVIM